jgi:hypothetical protein
VGNRHRGPVVIEHERVSCFAPGTVRLCFYAAREEE